MKKMFQGTLDELKAAVEQTGVTGQWTTIGEQHHLTTIDGAILVWYGRQVGTVMFQGKPGAEVRLQKRLATIFGDHADEMMKW
jgi:hypothetical protein